MSFWRFLFEEPDVSEDIREHVPRGCWDCEVLGICRDENNGWKCRHDCMVLPSTPSSRADDRRR